MTILLSSYHTGKRLQTLVSGCTDAILAINAEGIIVFANQEACKMTERDLNDLIGESIVEVYENIEVAREANRKIYEAGGTIHDMETRTRTKSGKILPARVSASHLYDSSGNYIGGIGYFYRYQPKTEDQIKAQLEHVEAVMESFRSLASTGMRSIKAFSRNFTEKIIKKD